jgi:hypothetical protein
MPYSVDFYKNLTIGKSYVMNDKFSDNPVNIIFNKISGSKNRIYLGNLIKKEFKDGGAVGREPYGTVEFEYNTNQTPPVGSMIQPNIVEATPYDTQNYLLAKEEAEIQEKEKLQKYAEIEADKKRKETKSNQAEVPTVGTYYPIGTILLLDDNSQIETTGPYSGALHYMGNKVTGVLSTGGKCRRRRNRKSKKTKKTRKSRKNLRKSKRRSRR